MPKYSSDLGCYSYLGIISIVIGAIYLLFSNPKELFNGTVNILTALLIFFVIIGLAIYLPGLFSGKQTKEKINDTIQVKDEQREREIEKSKNVTRKEKPELLSDEELFGIDQMLSVIGTYDKETKIEYFKIEFLENNKLNVKASVKTNKDLPNFKVSKNYNSANELNDDIKKNILNLDSI